MRTQPYTFDHDQLIVNGDIFEYSMSFFALYIS